jgi:hypothetical protein
MAALEDVQEQQEDQHPKAEADERSNEHSGEGVAPVSGIVKNRNVVRFRLRISSRTWEQSVVSPIA